MPYENARGIELTPEEAAKHDERTLVEGEQPATREVNIPEAMEEARAGNAFEVLAKNLEATDPAGAEEARKFAGIQEEEAGQSFERINEAARDEARKNIIALLNEGSEFDVQNDGGQNGRDYARAIIEYTDQALGIKPQTTQDGKQIGNIYGIVKIYAGSTTKYIKNPAAYEEISRWIASEGVANS